MHVHVHVHVHVHGMCTVCFRGGEMNSVPSTGRATCVAAATAGGYRCAGQRGAAACGDPWARTAMRAASLLPRTRLTRLSAAARLRAFLSDGDYQRGG